MDIILIVIFTLFGFCFFGYFFLMVFYPEWVGITGSETKKELEKEIQEKQRLDNQEKNKNLHDSEFKNKE